MSPPTNYFLQRTAAERYATGRPYIHPFIVDRIREFTSPKSFKTALDVGCGTGQSTRALAALVERVIGIDSASDMLAQAVSLAGVEYRQGDAESLPFPGAMFDLITVGLAFHWFDQSRFLLEARRVLKPEGWLVIYNLGCTGDMQEDPNFRHWFVDTYLQRYPSPPRAARGVTAELANAYGFDLHKHEVVTHGVPMSCVQFVEFLLTQSNVIAHVEQGSERLEDVAAFLKNVMAPFFGERPATMQFRIEMSYLRTRVES